MATALKANPTLKETLKHLNKYVKVRSKVSDLIDKVGQDVFEANKDQMTVDYAGKLLKVISYALDPQKVLKEFRDEEIAMALEDFKELSDVILERKDFEDKFIRRHELEQQRATSLAYKERLKQSKAELDGRVARLEESVQGVLAEMTNWARQLVETQRAFQLSSLLDAQADEYNKTRERCLRNRRLAADIQPQNAAEVQERTKTLQVIDQKLAEIPADPRTDGRTYVARALEKEQLCKENLERLSNVRAGKIGQINDLKKQAQKHQDDINLEQLHLNEIDRQMGML